jgi:hypothetical protein
LVKEISDCCAMILLPLKASSSNDILKFFRDFIREIKVIKNMKRIIG